MSPSLSTLLLGVEGVVGGEGVRCRPLDKVRLGRRLRPFEPLRSAIILLSCISTRYRGDANTCCAGKFRARQRDMSSGNEGNWAEGHRGPGCHEVFAT